MTSTISADVTANDEKKRIAGYLVQKLGRLKVLKYQAWLDLRKL